MYNYKDLSSTDVNKVDEGLNAIKNSLRNILYTRKGTFPGNPLFGADLQEYIFDLDDSVTAILMRNTVENAIRVWEKRVEVKDVNIESLPEYNKIILTVEFSLASDFNDTTYTVDLTL